jgi:hypothetical protein
MISWSFTTTGSIQPGWEHLGSRKVNYGLDRDVILVGAYEGVFRKLKIEVKGGSLNMHKMVVEYGNGVKDEIELRHNFGRKSASRIVDLNAGRRVIRDITFWYDSKNLSRRKAVVHVYGRY